MPLPSLVVGLLALVSGAAAMRVAGGAAGVTRRAASATMMAAEPTCAIIELSSDEPRRIAVVLQKAWMEGGIKRGLMGSVVVAKAGKVQIVASGQLKRLESFAEWCSTQLESEVKYYVDLDACPAVDLSSKFKFSDAVDVDNQPWADLLSETTAAMGKDHSSDEGLA